MFYILILALLNSFLFSSEFCSLKEEQKAKKVFLKSRKEINTLNKLRLIIKAKQICTFEELEIDLELLKIEYDLKNSNFSNLEERLQEVNIKNDQLLDSFKNYKYNTKLKIDKLFLTLYNNLTKTKYKSIIVTDIKKIDKKLARFKEIYKNRNSMKSLLKIGGVYKSNLYFAQDSFTIKNINEALKLKAFLEDIIKTNPNSKFTITGFASSEGNFNYNLKLSEKRAKSFFDFANLGEKNLKIFAKGEAVLSCSSGLFPEVDNNGEYFCILGEDREKSRKIEIKRVE